MRNLLKESDTKVNGHPISFIDIDETTMHTFAKVNVMKDGKVVKSLDNKEFNTHKLGDGETYNFDNFRDAKYFNQTSQPIEKTINRIKNIIQSIKDNKKQEKVIFLTARSDFDDKEVFLDTFRNFGIDVDIPNVYIERSGNLTDIKNVADRKKYVILKYLKTGLYTNAKMYDDDKKNLQTFEELGQEVNSGKYNILNNVKKNFPKINKINFYPLLVTDSGTIKKFQLSESVIMERIFPEIPERIYDRCLNATTFDCKKANSMTKWLCQLISNGKISENELFPNGYTYMTRDYFDLYEKYKKAGLIKDISKFNSWDEFKDEIIRIKYSDYKSNSEREEEARKGSRILLDNGFLKILEINSWEAAKKYGKGTKWCTSSEINDTYFNSYTRNDSNHLLYVFNENNKYGVSVRLFDDVYFDGKNYRFGHQHKNKNYEHTAEIDIEIFNEEDDLVYSLARMNAGTNIGEKVFNKQFLEKGIMYKNFSKELFFIIYTTILKTYASYLYEKYKEKNNLSESKKNFPKVNKINFYPLLVTDSGKIKMYESKDSNEEILIEAINAYHGSHKNFEEFETKYVGTGEDCQAHGWGLYFALNPDTGKGYHERISSSHLREKKNGTDTVLTYNGKRYDPKSVQGILINKMYKNGKSDTIRFLNNLSKESKFTKNPKQWKEDIKNLYNMVNKIDQSKFKESVTVKKGQFYTVKIPDLNTYLDEEKRIKNQDSYIVDKCKEIMIKLNKPFKAKDLTGRQFYEKLKFYSFKDGANVYSNSPKEVSEFLYDNGITGIKYDGRRDGECVVIFNQNDIKIVKKDVDYASMEKGLEMSDITKFIDDPKKLKGKRVPTEIIDWFIENRPELINDNVFREKLTLAQKIKLLLYSANYNKLENDYSDEIYKNVELQKELPEIDLVELFMQSISMSIRLIKYDKKYIEDIIKRIPIEIKKKYIQKFGTKCIERFLTSDNPSDEDKISILNEFFKDIKIDDIKDTSLKSNDRFVNITGKYNSTGWSDYMLYCDTLKYFVVLNEINSGSIGADKVCFDDIAIKCMEENRKSRIDIHIREELHIDKKVLPQFLNLLKYNKDGYYALFDNSYNIPEIANEIAEYYTEDVLKSFNQIDDPTNVPSIIKELISIDPVKLKFVNDEIFEVSLKYFHSNKLKIFDVNVLKELGESKIKVIFDFYLKDINSQFTGTAQTSYNRLKFLIENDLVNDKESILKTAKAQPELLLYYKNIDSKLQKIICSKNPYLIRFIRNPDKALINQIKTKIPNIEDYVESGE